MTMLSSSFMLKKYNIDGILFDVGSELIIYKNMIQFLTIISTKLLFHYP